MRFDLTSPDKVRIFNSKEDADALLPSDTGSITYQSVYTNHGKGWVIQRRHGGSVTGYLENEDA